MQAILENDEEPLKLHQYIDYLKKELNKKLSNRRYLEKLKNDISVGLPIIDKNTEATFVMPKLTVEDIIEALSVNIQDTQKINDELQRIFKILDDMQKKNDELLRVFVDLQDRREENHEALRMYTDLQNAIFKISEQNQRHDIHDIEALGGNASKCQAEEIKVIKITQALEQRLQQLRNLNDAIEQQLQKIHNFNIFTTASSNFAQIPINIAVIFIVGSVLFNFIHSPSNTHSIV